MNLGEVVVYKCKGMYKVEEVGTLNFAFADRKKKYYTLQSLGDSRDRAYVPLDDKVNIRKPVSKEDALNLIHKVDDIDELWVQNEKMREREYKDCISNYQPKEWVQILKTLYKRTKDRGSVTSMDKKYQQLIEHALYSELSYVLELPLNHVEQFIREEK
jgi:RNA polymerase-interacting CarD/CdnL/TRCF family regulator